jgi:hypothetical protein
MKQEYYLLNCNLQSFSGYSEIKGTIRFRKCFNCIRSQQPHGTLDHKGAQTLQTSKASLRVTA